MIEYDLLILVLACNQDPYKTIENEGIRKTWLNDVPDNVKVLFYYGDSPNTELDGDKLFINSPEGLMNIGYKTLGAFDYLQNNFKFKYLLRTNISSYIDISRLLNYLNDKPDSGYYNGIIGNHNGINFCSGSGYILSGDLIPLVLANKASWEHQYIDDVSLAILLRNLGVFPTPNATRFDVTDNNMDISNDYYHYRLKDWSNRVNDIIRFHKIHALKHGA